MYMLVSNRKQCSWFTNKQISKFGWKESSLWNLDLEKGKAEKMGVNSEEGEG